MGIFGGKDKDKIKEYKEAISSYQEQIKNLEQQLYFDTLTKCKNRKSFKEDMKIYESKTKYAIVAVSVDLEDINKKNRENGDAILSSVAKNLNEKFSNVYHISGTNFNILINLCDFNEETINKWAEEMLNKYPDIRLFIGIAKSTDGIGLGYFDITQIAIKRMFQDKRLKKSDNADINIQLEEQNRLEKLRKENAELEEEEYKTSNRLSMEKLTAIKERREKERILWENKKKFESNSFHLPEEEGSDMEETFDTKNLCTMWFNKEIISFEIEGQFYEYDFYIFPLSFVKPPTALPIVCVIDNRQNYKVLTGDIIKTGIARQKINVSARFDEDGNFITNIIFDDVTIKVNKDTKENKALYMPKNYGKEFFGKLLFPIKPNTNGTWDMAVYDNGEVSICGGSMNYENEMYSFVADSKAIYINH